MSRFLVEVDFGHTEAGVIACCDLFELIGCGDDEAEAVEDLQDQIDAITWH